MALKLLFAGHNPCMYDGYDSDILSLLGGEVGRLAEVTYTYPPGRSADHAAYDCFLGETSTTLRTRPVVTSNLTLLRGATTYRPLFLLDEGTNGYGVMFGVVVGSFCGQSVPNPYAAGASNLGPHTTAGSGKVTCWDKPGMYAVTLDAVATTITAASSIRPGDPLFATTAGKITATEANAFDCVAPGDGTATIVGRFSQLSTGGSLVTTPAWMVGLTSSVMSAASLLQLEFHFRIEN